MRAKFCIAAAFALAGLAAAAPVAKAATLSGGVVPADMREALVSVDKVAYRRCHWRRGVKRCRWYDDDDDDDRAPRRYRPEPYYERDANRIPFGTSRWWEQMEREDRAGRRR